VEGYCFGECSRLTRAPAERGKGLGQRGGGEGGAVRRCVVEGETEGGGRVEGGRLLPALGLPAKTGRRERGGGRQPLDSGKRGGGWYSRVQRGVKRTEGRV